MQFSYRFDSVSNAHDQFSFFLHLIHKLHGDNPTVEGFAEHFSRSIQCSTKPVSLGANQRELQQRTPVKAQNKHIVIFTVCLAYPCGVHEIKVRQAPGIKHLFLTQHRCQ